MKYIDINCDLGEGIGNDEAIMPYISSANIACGFHAGNNETMDYTIELALKNKIAIGAHPGYPDKENFGRTEINLSHQEIIDIVSEQISILYIKANSAATTLKHVKPHGALYNQAANNLGIAKAIAESIKSIDKNLIYVGLANSAMKEAALEYNLKFRAEAFADRAYTNTGLLVPRKEKNAIISEADKCGERALKIAQQKNILSIDNREILINAQTICIHGDNKHAFSVSKMIYKYLTQNNIKITANV